MTETSETQRVGTPTSAYIALALGIIAIATFAFPPIPVIAGAVGLAAALYARSILRRHETVPGTVPSLLGAILCLIGIATALPWVIGALIVAFSG